MFLAESAFHLSCVHIAKCNAGSAVSTRSSVCGVIVECFLCAISTCNSTILCREVYS